MPKYPMPQKEGWFWVKLVHPTNMPEGEDWASTEWEVVQMVENYLGPADDDEKWYVSVGGIAPCQWPLDFIWGPEVIKPIELK